MKINHSILGEMSIEDIKKLSLAHKMPYSHSTIVKLCDKLLEQEGKLTKFIGNVDDRFTIIQKTLKERTSGKNI